ncbi:MAG: STAS/SEC14 domain-containing protein, partial [Propionibacteriaceae bacterium]|nr:STAS/SEC14 domain-containing protein [Propionibacteriaceae bacterium]
EEVDMLTTRAIPDTNIVEVNFTGALRVEDEQVLHATLQEAIDAHDKIRVLASIGTIEWGRIEPAAALMDAKAAKFLPHVERAAVVVEPGVVEKLTAIVGALVPGARWRPFDPDQREAAEIWLRA